MHFLGAHTTVSEHGIPHEETNFYRQDKEAVTEPEDARHWRAARQAVSCSGLCTA